MPMIFKELSIPLFLKRGASEEHLFSITHVALDDEGQVVAGVGKQLEGNPHGDNGTTFLGLTGTEPLEARDLIKGQKE